MKKQTNAGYELQTDFNFPKIIIILKITYLRKKFKKTDAMWIKLSA